MRFLTPIWYLLRLPWSLPTTNSTVPINPCRRQTLNKGFEKPKPISKNRTAETLLAIRNGDERKVHPSFVSARYSFIRIEGNAVFPSVIRTSFQSTPLALSGISFPGRNTAQKIPCLSSRFRKFSAAVCPVPDRSLSAKMKTSSTPSGISTVSKPCADRHDQHGTPVAFTTESAVSIPSATASFSTGFPRRTAQPTIVRSDGNAEIRFGAVTGALCPSVERTVQRHQSALPVTNCSHHHRKRLLNTVIETLSLRQCPKILQNIRRKF